MCSINAYDHTDFDSFVCASAHLLPHPSQSQYVKPAGRPNHYQAVWSRPMGQHSRKLELHLPENLKPLGTTLRPVFQRPLPIRWPSFLSPGLLLQHQAFFREPGVHAHLIRGQLQWEVWLRAVVRHRPIHTHQYSELRGSERVAPDES